jgi:tripartite-type tricarboxylate transporter receptor subunit TctC
VASTGADSAQYLWIAGLDSKLDMNPIYYKGGSPAMTDLAAGHVEYAVMSLTLTHQFANKGMVTPLVISATKRHPLMPNVPTYRELGWKGEPGNFWYGFMALRETDQKDIAKFNQAVADVVRTNRNIKNMEDQGLVFDMITGDSANDFFDREIQKYKSVRERVLRKQ